MLRDVGNKMANGNVVALLVSYVFVSISQARVEKSFSSLLSCVECVKVIENEKNWVQSWREKIHGIYVTDFRKQALQLSFLCWSKQKQLEKVQTWSISFLQTCLIM